MKQPRTVPGLIEVGGKEFFYVEIAPKETFLSLMNLVWEMTPTVQFPIGGGIIEQRARLIIEGQAPLFAVSYRGDIEGWRRKLVAFCESAHRLGGPVKNRKVVLNNGSQIDLRTARVVFE